MRKYETIAILESDISEEQRQPLYDKLKEFIAQHKGFLITLDEWGSKRLAYSIRKQSRGFYTRLEYCGNGELVDAMENFFRINDRFLKYMTVLLQKDVDIETVKAEIAAAQAQEAAAQAPVETDSNKPGKEPAPADVDTESEPASDIPMVSDMPAGANAPSSETPQADTPSPETVETEIKQEEA